MKSPYLIALTAGLCLPFSSAQQVEKPNIIIFYVDDLGWQDVQLNDLDDACAYDTPNITKLAERGMNMTQGYSPAPTCSPSRAGIITGQHPAKIGMTHVTLARVEKTKQDQKFSEPYLQEPLDLTLPTIADVMKENGYKTGHSGKWHIGLSAESYGFEVVNQDRGAHRSMEDRTKGFATADDKIYPLSKEKYPPVSEKNPDGISYPYDEVTESAITFMKESGDQPFFLNLCHWMVHWPAVTRNGELLEYYADKIGLNWPLEPGDSTLPGQQNPYFSSMVTTVDWSLGKVVDFLEKTDDPRNPGKKLSEATYIFFTSDNGGAEARGAEILSDNAPLKYGKGYAEEGGVRVPMVISGPGIPAGSTFNGLVNQLDYFPTILALTQSEIDAEEKSDLSGADISPVLTAGAENIIEANGDERNHLFWHFPHPHGDSDSMRGGIRSGEFKLYKRYASGGYELYQLYKDGARHDIEEENDLAENPEFSATVESLSKILEASLTANNAEGPYLNPYYTENTLPVAKLGKISLEGSTQLATASLTEVKATQAYIVYTHDPSKAEPKGKRGSQKAVSEDAAIPGMRAPATVSEDGMSVTATVPKGVSHFCFLVIDENNFMQFSKIYPPTEALKKGKKNKKNK